MNTPVRCLGVMVLAVILLVASNSLLSRTNGPRPTEQSLARVSPSGLRGGWSDGTQAVHPPGVAGSMMAYDSRNNVFVLFGGSDGEALNQTWILDPHTRMWSEVHPELNPPARADAMFVYDSAAEALVLFGGWYETHDGAYHRLGDTWAFYVASNTWVQRHPQASPPPRSDAAVAYDETEGATLVFGGFDGVHYLGDQWYYVFANDTWAPRPSPRLPSPRADGRMVYDAGRRAFFLFSGNDYSDANFNFHHPADMWRYRWDQDLWSQVYPDVMPMPRDYPILATNSASGELLLVGGYGNRTILGDTWTFNTTQLVWRNVSTPDGPSPRMAAVGGYDTLDDTLVVYGGGDKLEVKTDTWFFRYPPPLTGNIFVSSPSPITGQSVAFRAEMVGGSGEISRVSWDFGDGQTSHNVSTAHSYGTPGIYRIQFTGRDSRGAEISWTMDLDIGLFVPLWMDISLLIVGIASASILILLWIRHRRKSRP